MRARTQRTDERYERRLVMRVLTHWRSMGGEAGLPRRSAVDPQRFGRDWSNCLLIDVGPEAHDSRFSFVGEDLRDPHWPTFERQRIGECVEHTLLHCATSFLDRVLTEQASVAEGIGTHRGTPVLYRSILLPLSEDGSRVDGVLGATNYRDVA
jgi:hypothetical protein